MGRRVPRLELTKAATELARAAELRPLHCIQLQE